ncbi:13537_t:CDS:2, partial [Ambispora leptoticha]
MNKLGSIFGRHSEYEGIDGSVRRSSATTNPIQKSPLKRYAMYDLDWQEFKSPEEDVINKKNGSITMDSALAAKQIMHLSTTSTPNTPTTSFLSQPQPRPTSSTVATASSTRSLHPHHHSVHIDLSSQTSRDSQDIIGTPPLSPMGITVTKVKVVEYHSATEDESSTIPTRSSIQSPSSLPSSNRDTFLNNFRNSAQALNMTLLRTKSKHRHSFSDSDLNALSASEKKSKTLHTETPSSNDNNQQQQHDDESSNKPKAISQKNGTRERKKGKSNNNNNEVKKSQHKPKKPTSKGKGKRKSLAANAVQPDVPTVAKGWEQADERYFNAHPAAQYRKLKRSGNTMYRKQRGAHRTLRHVELAPTSNPAYSNDPTDLEDDNAPLPSYDHRFPWVPKPLHPPQLIHATLVPLPHRATSHQLISEPGSSIAALPQISRRNSKILPKATTSSNRSSRINPPRITRIISSNPKRLSRVGSQRKRTSIIVTGGKRSSVLLRRQLLEDSIMMSLLGGAYAVPSGNNRASTLLGQQQKTIIRRKTKKSSNAKIEDREARRNNQWDTGSEATRLSEELRPEQKPVKSDINLESSEPPPFPTHLMRTSTYFETNSTVSRLPMLVSKIPPPPTRARKSPIQNSKTTSDDEYSEAGRKSTTAKSNGTLPPLSSLSPTSPSLSPSLSPSEPSKKYKASLFGLFNKQSN